MQLKFLRLTILILSISQIDFLLIILYIYNVEVTEKTRYSNTTELFFHMNICKYILTYMTHFCIFNIKCFYTEIYMIENSYKQHIDMYFKKKIKYHEFIVKPTQKHEHQIVRIVDFLFSSNMTSTDFQQH